MPVFLKASKIDKIELCSIIFLILRALSINRGSSLSGWDLKEVLLCENVKLNCSQTRSEISLQ